jgi:hypothetical protein
VPASLLAAALLAACSSAPPGPRPQLDHGLVAALDPADFPGAKTLLDGFDPPAAGADDAFRVGDRALFALAVHDGGRVERRLLELRVTELALRGVLRTEDGQTIPYRVHTGATVTMTAPNATATFRFEVTPLTVEVSQRTADGALVRSSTVTLYEELLRTGMRGLGGDDAATAARAYLLLQTLQQLGAADPVLAEQLFAIADRPSLWSVIWSAGVHVVLTGGAIAPWRGPISSYGSSQGSDDGADDGAVERAVLPLDVSVNGADSLWTDVLVAEARPPFALAAGVLGAIARHGADPQRYAVLRLLAARRGQAPRIAEKPR